MRYIIPLALALFAGCGIDPNHFVIDNHPDIDWDNDGITDAVDPIVPVAGWDAVLVDAGLFTADTTPTLTLNEHRYVIIDDFDSVEIAFGEL